MTAARDRHRKLKTGVRGEHRKLKTAAMGEHIALSDLLSTGEVRNRVEVFPGPSNGEQ